MKANKRNIIMIISALVLGILLGWMIFGGTSGERHNNHKHSALSGQVESVWTCSMHPQIRQPEPGKCPICAMDLIPLENEQDETLDPNAIRMSATAMKLADIQTVVVGTTEPVKFVRLNGKVQADERLVFSQSSHLPGRIEKLMVNFTGEFVKEGQVIASIYSPDLVNAQEELFEARRIKDTQPQLFESAMEKLKNWKLTDVQIENILARAVPQEQFDILADGSGYVTQKLISKGDYISKGATIYELADLSTVWLLFDIYESDIPWVKKGDLVTFIIASMPGETFTGNIAWLDPVIDPKTRVVRARVEAENHLLRLKPEMFASGTVESKLTKRTKHIVVPKTAVMWTGKRSVVYVKSVSSTGTSFLMREVTLGPALGDGYMIENGVEMGEEIAVNGTFSIDAAAQLAGKPSMMSRAGGTTSASHNHGEMQKRKVDKEARLKHIDFHVSGNCEMCKTTIEEAAKTVQGVKMAEWNQASKRIHVSFQPGQASEETIHKAIAGAGYDTEKEKASEEAYKKLPGCCRYTRMK